MNVEVDIVDVCVQIDFIQTWTNSKENPVEAIYNLALSKNTAISKFVVTLDGKKVVGVVKEKEEAAREYEDAISSGKGAFLVEKSERLDLNEFKMSVGNLLPKQSVKVEVSFISLLRDNKGSHQFSLAENLFPSSNLNIPVELNARIFMSEKIKSIKCTQQGAVIGKDYSTVKWKRNPGVTSGFELDIIVDNKTPSAVIEVDVNKPDVMTCMITHYPTWTNVNTECLEPKMEVIFVVDRSGSMCGDRWEQTRKAMNLLVHAIPQESKFNIVGFGSSVDWLFPNSVPYTEENLKKANETIQRMQADLGGTELFAPLRAIYSKPIDPEYPRIIIVLTDGCVDNRDKTIEEVKIHSEDGKLFSIGIGSDVDKALVEGLAQSGRGLSTFVVNEKDIDKGVMDLFAKAFEPCLKDIKINWNSNINVKQTPARNVTIPNNSRMVFFGLIEKGNFADTITITASDPEGSPLTWKLPVKERRKGDLIQRLAAFSLIRDLQEGNSSYHTGSDLTEEVKNKIKEEIIRLGVTYQLASNHTSFVAIEERTDMVAEGSMQLENIPSEKIVAPEPEIINSPAHDIPQSLSAPYPSQELLSDYPQDLCEQSFCEREMCMEEEKISFDNDCCDDEDTYNAPTSIYQSMSAAPPQKLQIEKNINNDIVSTPKVTVIDIQQIISEQKFDGSWSPQSITKLFKITTDQFDNYVKKTNIDQDVFATAYAIAYLEKHHSNTNSWKMNSRKAKSFITKSLGVTDKKEAMNKAEGIIKIALGFLGPEIKTEESVLDSIVKFGNSLFSNFK